VGQIPFDEKLVESNSGREVGGGSKLQAPEQKPWQHCGKTFTGFCSKEKHLKTKRLFQEAIISFGNSRFLSTK